MKCPSILSSAAVTLSAAALLAACGGARPIPSESPEEAAEREDRDRRARRDSGDDEGDELPLGDAVAVEGTGVHIRPPRGSERSAMGSTFIHPRRRIQLVIAAAEGDLSVHQQFRAGLTAEADEVETDDVEIDGGTGTITIDRMTQGDVELERVWLIARRGTRSAAAMGVYQADRSDTLRDLMRASVMSMRFDEETPIDPEEAVGWRLSGVEGLQLVRTASTNVSYSVDGQPPQNDAMSPMLFLVPIPIEVPAEQRSSLCTRILDQLVQVPEDATPERHPIDAGEVQGCDVVAAAGESGQQTTYAALVFRGPAAFMVGGTVGSTQRDPWIARFRGAAGTLSSVRPLPSGSSMRPAIDEEEEEEEEEEE